MDLLDGAVPTPGAFTASRWLSGANRAYPGPAVVLQPLGPWAQDGAAQGRWIAKVVDMARVLGWPDPLPRVLVHKLQASGQGPGDSHIWLSFAAPADRLHTAVALNEWAWAAVAAPGPDPGAAHPLGPDPVAHFKALAAAEDRPALTALAAAAAEHSLPLLLDDSGVTLGEGAGSITYPLTALPEPADVPWPRLQALPKLLVTGSHGKTTVLRLLAAMAREAGLVPGLAGSPGAPDARSMLRNPAVSVALLEVPRLALLQEGLVVKQAQVAVVTNVSADPADGLTQQELLDEHAATLLVVAHAVASEGALVMNGDDAAMLRVALGLAHSAAPSWALFGQDHAAPLMEALRRHGGSTCAPRKGRLVLVLGGVEHDFGPVADMPLSLGGAALQNVANLCCAALAAALAGWPPQAIGRALTQFGAAPADNPGRLQRFSHRGATVLVDSARTPVELTALLKLAGALGARRVGLLLGQDGACSNDAITALARCAAGFHPDRVVIKDLPGLSGSRAPGTVPLLLEQGLRAAGLSSRALRHEDDEEAAARQLLEWAKKGDVLLLPLHDPAVIDRLAALLES